MRKGDNPWCHAGGRGRVGQPGGSQTGPERRLPHAQLAGGARRVVGVVVSQMRQHVREGRRLPQEQGQGD